MKFYRMQFLIVLPYRRLLVCHVDLVFVSAISGTSHFTMTGTNFFLIITRQCINNAVSCFDTRQAKRINNILSAGCHQDAEEAIYKVRRASRGLIKIPVQ
jgi:hypothetical protein